MAEMFSAVAAKRKSEGGDADGDPQSQDKKRKLEGEEKDAPQKLGKCPDISNIRCLLSFCVVCAFIGFINFIIISYCMSKFRHRNTENFTNTIVFCRSFF